MKNDIKQFGFTLVEVMLVIVVAGVLTTVAAINYTGALETQKSQEGINVLRTLYRAQKAYEINYGAYTSDINNLDVSIPELKYFAQPAANDGPIVAYISHVIDNLGNEDYILTINDDGRIRCGGAAPAPVRCVRIGYTHDFVIPTL